MTLSEVSDHREMEKVVQGGTRVHGRFWAVLLLDSEEIRLLREVLAVAVLSGFLTSLVIWWAIVGRARKSGVGRGLISGIACGVLVHPVCWSLADASNSLMILLGKLPRQPLGEQPFTVPHEVVAVLALSVWSLLFYGWMTVVAGALTGGVLGAWRDAAEGPNEGRDVPASPGPQAIDPSDK